MPNNRFLYLPLVFLSSLLLPAELLHAAMTPPGTALTASVPPPAGQEPTALLQYESGGQLLGFSREKMYAVGSGGTALVEEFVGASGVMPSAAANGGEMAASGAMKPGGKAPPFTGVTYQGLWQGINLSYRPTPDGFAESVYEINAGSELSRIKLRYNVPVVVQKDGSLKFTPPANKGYFMQSPPVAWQVIDGINQPVAVAFRQGTNRSDSLQTIRSDGLHIRARCPGKISHRWKRLFDLSCSRKATVSRSPICASSLASAA